MEKMLVCYKEQTKKRIQKSKTAEDNTEQQGIPQGGWIEPNNASTLLLCSYLCPYKPLITSLSVF